MGEAIGEVLTLAVGVAISPVPIIAVILMLFTRRAVSNGLAFLIGWVLAVAVVAIAFYVLADTQEAAADTGPATAISIIKLALGALLVFAAIRQWRGRPSPGEEASMPKWMAAVDRFSPGRSFGIAVLLGGVNPKNLALAAAAGATVAGLQLTTGESVGSILVFAVLASLSIAVPVVYRVFAGGRAQTTLDGWKRWLQANNATVMSVLLLVLGAVLAGRSIAELSA